MASTIRHTRHSSSMVPTLNQSLSVSKDRANHFKQNASQILQSNYKSDAESKRLQGRNNSKTKAQTIHSIVLQHPEVSGIVNATLPSLKSRKKWTMPSIDDYGPSAMMSRSRPYQPKKPKPQAILYDFNDPVLNKEFRQAATRYN